MFIIISVLTEGR